MYKKRGKIPSLYEFNKILNSISPEEKIGHLFLVDIIFHHKNEKTLLFNEIYTSILEKDKVVQAYQCSVLQHMSVISRNEDKDTVNNFKSNAKTHAPMDEKKFIPLYAEHLHILVTRAGWLVTKIYRHFTFE